MLDLRRLVSLRITTHRHTSKVDIPVVLQDTMNRYLLAILVRDQVARLDRRDLQCMLCMVNLHQVWKVQVALQVLRGKNLSPTLSVTPLII